jgi:hypothetical protein
MMFKFLRHHCCMSAAPRLGTVDVGKRISRYQCTSQPTVYCRHVILQKFVVIVLKWRVCN